MIFVYKVTVGSLELSANKDIRQVIEIVEDYGKYRVLAKHLQVKVVEAAPAGGAAVVVVLVRQLRRRDVSSFIVFCATATTNVPTTPRAP